MALLSMRKCFYQSIYPREKPDCKYIFLVCRNSNGCKKKLWGVGFQKTQKESSNMHLIRIIQTTKKLENNGQQYIF